MHIFMNMMSTMAIGTMLERQIGSAMMGITILWGIVLTSTIYILISWLLFVIFGYEKMMLQHSVGFSCVIFQLSVLESSINPDRTRSLFGLFSVPSRLYPWALLVFLQFVMPNISFLGHLSGILVGTLQYFGALDVLFPSEGYIRDCESSSERMAMLMRQPGYVILPEQGLRRETPDVRSALSAGFGCITAFISNVCDTNKVCIFGRGADANANISLGEFSAAWGSSDVTTATSGAGTIQPVEDDEEWVGLPAAIQRSTEEM